MISSSTAFRHFDRAPTLSYWTVATIASAITALIIVHVARNLYEWLRMWWYLRGVPRPRPKQSFTLLIDMYKQLSAMDPSLDLKVKSFKYLQGLFKSVEDQDVTVAFFGPYPFLLGSTPQVVEAILGNTENVDRSFFYNMIKPWVGGGMLTQSGESWRNRRKAIKPGYHFRILDGYIPIMNKTGERMMKQVASMDGEFFDVLPIARAATLDVLFETTMGVDYDEHRIERVGYLKIHDAISDSIANRASYFHYWFDSIYAFSKEYKEMKRNVQKAKDFIDAMVHKRLADYRKGIKNPISSNVFIEILVRMCVDEGTMTEVDIRDECMANLIGGFDTSATNIASTLYLLGLHPEIQAKVHDEIDLVCGDDWEKPVTVEELKNLAYTECVVKESLRLYPPVPIIGRAVTKEFQIGNYTIPRGTVAIVASYFLQRHPRFFEDPDAFIPERFLDTKKINTYAFAAFSGGPRNCLGQTFAIREAKIFLTHILRRFEVTSKIPMDELVMTTDLILKPTQGLEIRLTPRRTPSAG